MSDNDMDYDAIQGHLRAIADPVAARAGTAIDQLRARVAELDRQLGQTIDERDAAEDALTDCYRHVMGESPTWSNQFGFSDAVNDCANRNAELEGENGRLRIALHDAINRPKGVVPESAESFYEPMRCLQAEAQRMGLYGGSEE